MQKHQQLVTSLGATVVMADAENDFLIAEHTAEDNNEQEQTRTRSSPPLSEFSSAVKSLLTSTTCHKF